MFSKKVRPSLYTGMPHIYLIYICQTCDITSLMPQGAASCVQMVRCYCLIIKVKSFQVVSIYRTRLHLLSKEVSK